MKKQEEKKVLCGWTLLDNALDVAEHTVLEDSSTQAQFSMSTLVSQVSSLTFYVLRQDELYEASLDTPEKEFEAKRKHFSKLLGLGTARSGPLVEKVRLLAESQTAEWGREVVEEVQNSEVKDDDLPREKNMNRRRRRKNKGFDHDKASLKRKREEKKQRKE